MGLHDPPALAVTADIDSNRTHNRGHGICLLILSRRLRLPSPLTLWPSQQGCDAISQVYMHLRNRAHCESFLIRRTPPSAVRSRLKGEGLQTSDNYSGETTASVFSAQPLSPHSVEQGRRANAEKFFSTSNSSPPSVPLFSLFFFFFLN